MFPLRQLRASADQRVHYAVVPHHVRHLPAGAHRAEDLGLGLLRGLGGAVPGRPRHLGEAGRVSGALLTEIRIHLVRPNMRVKASNIRESINSIQPLQHISFSTFCLRAGGSNTVRQPMSFTARWAVSLRRCWSATSSLPPSSCRYEINKLDFLTSWYRICTINLIDLSSPSIRRFIPWRCFLSLNWPSWERNTPTTSLRSLPQSNPTEGLL